MKFKLLSKISKKLKGRIICSKKSEPESERLSTNSSVGAPDKATTAMNAQPNGTSKVSSIETTHTHNLSSLQTTAIAPSARTGPVPPRRRSSGGGSQMMRRRSKKGSAGANAIAPAVAALDETLSISYDQIPQLELTKLPRGGVSVYTEAVGRVQFGIPPETIKDSLDLEGLEVPQYYIVPVERFCREMGRALGVNLAEFEFPAYYNFFLLGRRCTLIVDSDEAERNIRRVFSETLLGPAQFRREENPIAFEEEDFSPDFPRDAIPNFQKELKHFRTLGGKELVLETLLNFCHFEARHNTNVLGVPPPLNEDENFFVNDEKKDIPISRGSLLTGSIVNTESNGECVNLSDGNDKISIDCEDSEHLIPVRMDPIRHFEKKKSISSISCGVSSTHYARTIICNEVATIFPNDATPEEIASRNCKRIEIFKMPGGMEYIIHDINEKNIIIGKTRFSGNVRVSESLGVHGFSSAHNKKNADNKQGSHSSITHYENIPQHVAPPTFYPPSFGVTVLGNSHGFDKQGSVSGYVLWINGRGVMIDPPPYSSATLEREGIRPRTIVGIIITHCHADHDAGAFQKVLTGSPVVVITTPTIYKSFIRKYAALSALSPVILRHCHRHKPAIIGQPLRFQGATFHFTYTFHTIPCVGFRVEWRGRSMVFTGDHFNDEDSINKLQEEGVMSAARAQDLRNLPLQHTDLLLHEAGIPPIHTPLANLLKLPKRVRDRLYVVHTSQLPPDCDLRVAPTGTAGTIRLDELDGHAMNNQRFNMPDRRSSSSISNVRRSSVVSIPEEDYSDDDSLIHSASLFNYSEYDNNFNFNDNSFSTLALQGTTNKHINAPPVALRPTSSTDAWFILNLLSAVPFLSGLSYNSTMEVLETARVDAFSKDDVVVPAARRNQVLCVVWEGTCMERRCRQGDEISEVTKFIPTRRNSFTTGNRYGRNEYTKENDNSENPKAVWYAGDWTGPRTLQPDKDSSGASDRSETHDIVAISQEGVKVITIDFSNLHSILKSGSSLYRAYLARLASRSNPEIIDVCLKNFSLKDSPTYDLFAASVRNLNINEIIDSNMTLRKLSEVQKRHLESLAQGPIYFPPGDRLWRSGAAVENAYLIVAGTVTFVSKRCKVNKEGFEIPTSLEDAMIENAQMAVAEIKQQLPDDDEISLNGSIDSDLTHETIDTPPLDNGHEIVKYILETRAKKAGVRSDSANVILSGSKSIEFSNNDVNEDDSDSLMDSIVDSDSTTNRDDKLAKSGSFSKYRYASKQLVRLYNQQSYADDLTFSRGHFLGDISKMMAGLLSNTDETNFIDEDHSTYGFGEKVEDGNGKSIDITIHEQEGGAVTVHSSTLASGKDGVVVLVFPKSSLIQFLDEYPGVLLSLLGTQVVL